MIVDVAYSQSLKEYCRASFSVHSARTFWNRKQSKSQIGLGTAALFGIVTICNLEHQRHITTGEFGLYSKLRLGITGNEEVLRDKKDRTRMEKEVLSH